MKTRMDTNHCWLEWIAFSFITLGFTGLWASSFKVYFVDFDWISIPLLLIGLGYFIALEFSKLDHKQVNFLMEANTLMVYLNSHEDEVDTTDHHGLIRQINSTAEWNRGKTITESGPGTATCENPRSKDVLTRVIEKEDSGILVGPEIIDFKTFYSSQEDRPEKKINKKFLPLVEPAGQVAGTKQENPFQKDAAEILEEYKHYFKHSHDLICVVKPNGTLDRLNPNFEKTLGYSKNELLGKHFITFVHPEDIELTLTAIDNLGSGEGSKNFINRYRRIDGSYCWLEWNISTDGGNGKWYGIARDIADRKKAEYEIDQLNLQLDQKVSERTRQLEAANQELEAFTYSVSHDLRAPLRAVGSYAQMLEEDYLNLLDDEGKRLLLIIRSSAEKMGTLIDDLLAFSRLGKQSIQKTTVDLNESARVTLEELQQVYGHRATIQMQPLPSVLCDGALIRQVLTNLLDNAIKYSSKKENPVIELFARQEGAEIVFCVRDNGAGFDMRYVQKLFGVFERLHTDKEYEGTGVGLAIADRIIAKHGGTMWAESILGKGAAFYFSLPVAG